MKKIIALAVASAFVAPVMAAEVSVTGAMGYVLAETDGQQTITSNAQDIVVTATDEIGNGMTVTAYVSMEGDEATPGRDSNEVGDFDTMITLSGAFGTLDIGDDADAGFNAFDNKSDVAEAGLDTTISSGVTTDTHAAQFKPAMPVEGLDLAIGYAEGTAAGVATIGFGIQYAIGGLKIAYGLADAETETDNASHISVSYATGPLYFAIDSYDNQSGVAGDQVTAMAATYNYGAGKVYAETRKTDDGGADPTINTVIYGVSYGLGGGVNTFIQNQNAESVSSGAVVESDTVSVGIEYSF